MQVFLTRQHLGLVFVHLEHIYVLQGLALLFPIHGKHLLTTHLAKVALSIHHQGAMTMKRTERFEGKVIGQQRSEHDIACLYTLQFLRSERIGLIAHALMTLVAIGRGINVFKIDCTAAGNHLHLDTYAAHILYGMHLLLGQ